MKKAEPSDFDRKHMADTLLSQAQLCERIAAMCADEVTAQKFAAMAKDCRDAAAEETKVTPAVWPVTVF